MRFVQQDKVSLFEKREVGAADRVRCHSEHSEESSVDASRRNAAFSITVHLQNTERNRFNSYLANQWFLHVACIHSISQNDLRIL